MGTDAAGRGGPPLCTNSAPTDDRRFSRQDSRPWWPELWLALASALASYLIGAIVVFTLPLDPVASGLAQFALSGLAQLAAFGVATLRLRDLRPFGFRRVQFIEAFPM